MPKGRQPRGGDTGQTPTGVREAATRPARGSERQGKSPRGGDVAGVFQEATAAELGEGEGSQTTQRRRGARAGRWVPTLSDCGAVSARAPGPNVSRNILCTLCVFEHVSNFKKK